MKNVFAILKKQIKDTFKNKMILIQFVLFPVIDMIMEQAIKIDGMPENYFTNLFGVMYVGMAPLVSVSSIIGEEKEKNTLRVLTMANVKSLEYLLGILTYVWSICMCGAFVMSLNLPSEKRAFFMLVMAIGALLSGLLGAAIGIFAKNQMMTTSLSMPVMLVFSFAPMLSMFNEKISKVARFLYTVGMQELIEKNSVTDFKSSPLWVIIINAVLFLGFFLCAYKRKGLE